MGGPCHGKSVDLGKKEGRARYKEKLIPFLRRFIKRERKIRHPGVFDEGLHQKREGRELGGEEVPTFMSTWGKFWRARGMSEKKDQIIGKKKKKTPKKKSKKREVTASGELMLAGSVWAEKNKGFFEGESLKPGRIVTVEKGPSPAHLLKGKKHPPCGGSLGKRHAWGNLAGKKGALKKGSVKAVVGRSLFSITRRPWGILETAKLRSQGFLRGRNG